MELSEGEKKIDQHFCFKFVEMIKSGSKLDYVEDEKIFKFFNSKKSSSQCYKISLEEI